MEAISLSPRLGKRQPALDGLRGVFIVLTVLANMKVAYVVEGYDVGMGSLFVLFGFVVTNRMLEDIQEEQTVDFPNYFFNKVKRIIPLYCMVLISSLLTFFSFIPYTITHNALQWRGAILFTENFMIGSLSELPIEEYNNPVLPLFSLHIGIQMGIIYPFLFNRVSKLCSFQVRKIGISFGVKFLIVLAVLLWGMIDAGFYAEAPAIGFGIRHYLHHLLTGAILAICLTDYNLQRVQRELNSKRNGGIVEFPSVEQERVVGALCGLCGLGLFGFLLVGNEDRSTSLVTQFLISIGASLLILAVQFHFSPLRKLLSTFLFQSLGKVSYSLYLCHYPILCFGREYGGWNFEFYRLEYLFVIALISTSFLALEHAIIDSEYFQFPKQQKIACGVMFLCSIFIVFAGTEPGLFKLGLAGPIEIQTKGEISIQYLDSLESNPRLELSPPEMESPLVPLPLPIGIDRGMDPSLSTTYFFHGDSFAGEWLLAAPLLAEALNSTVTVHTINGTPWFHPQRPSIFKMFVGNFIPPKEIPNALPRDFGKMQEAWDTMLDVPGNKVVVLVSATVHQSFIYRSNDDTVFPYQESWKEEIFASIVDFLGPMLQRDPNLRFVNLLAHGYPHIDIISCLNTKVPSECVEPAPEIPLPGIHDYILLLSDLKDIWGERFLSFSINDLLCPNQMCNAIDLEGHPIYSDSMHLKKEWIRDHIVELYDIMLPFL